MRLIVEYLSEFGILKSIRCSACTFNEMSKKRSLKLEELQTLSRSTCHLVTWTLRTWKPHVLNSNCGMRIPLPLYEDPITMMMRVRRFWWRPPVGYLLLRGLEIWRQRPLKLSTSNFIPPAPLLARSNPCGWWQPSNYISTKFGPWKAAFNAESQAKASRSAKLQTKMPPMKYQACRIFHWTQCYYFILFSQPVYLTWSPSNTTWRMRLCMQACRNRHRQE
jgi:hypothetical protein